MGLGCSDFEFGTCDPSLAIWDENPGIVGASRRGPREAIAAGGMPSRFGSDLADPEQRARSARDACRDFQLSPPGDIIGIRDTADVAGGSRRIRDAATVFNNWKTGGAQIRSASDPLSQRTAPNP